MPSVHPIAVNPSTGDLSYDDDVISAYEWDPADHNFLAWTVDPGVLPATSSALSSAGTLHLVRLHVPTAISVTNIVIYVSVAGSTLTAGQCFAALYTAAGARVAVTADQATAWASTGVKTMALASGPFSLTAGDHYVGMWFNGTTGPTLARSAGLGAAITNIGLSAPNLRCATADTGLTTAAPATLGAQTAAGILWWVALS